MNRTNVLARNVATHAGAVLLLVAWLSLACLLSGCGHRKGSPQMTPDRGCELRLATIGFGIGQYKQTHGRLPAPIVVGPQGDKHSWRAAVMPYLLHAVSDAHLFDYRMEEPWDSPHNREVWPEFRLAFMFACSAESRQEPGPFPYTSYLMLVRPPVAPSTIADEPSRELPPEAVLIVESAGCGVEYFEPRDLPWENLWEGDSPFGEGKLNSFHPRVVKAVRVDGKVIDIPKSISREKLKKLLSGTVTGEE